MPRRIAGQWLMALSEAITSLRSENEDLKAIKFPLVRNYPPAYTHVHTCGGISNVRKTYGETFHYF